MAERTLFPDFHPPSKKPKEEHQRFFTALVSVIENPTPVTRRRVLQALILGLAAVVAGESIASRSASKDLSKITPEDLPSFQPGNELNYKRAYENIAKTFDWMKNSNDSFINQLDQIISPYQWSSASFPAESRYAQVEYIQVDGSGQRDLKIVLFHRSFDKQMGNSDFLDAAKQLYYSVFILGEAKKNPHRFATDPIYRRQIEQKAYQTPFLLPPPEQFTY